VRSFSKLLLGVNTLKSEILLAWQLMNSLYENDVPNTIKHTQTLAIQLSDKPELSGYKTFMPLCESLMKLLEQSLTGKEISLRDCNVLRSPLIAFLSDIVKDIDVQEIQQLGISVAEEWLLKRANLCFPLDIFNYDRLYLSGKLNSLCDTRKDTQIIISGSSYAMVGIKESLMPQPAVNFAVNAQDPFYTFLGIERARKSCPKINTAVIVGGYYFWHTDMSAIASDYYTSVLSRVNYPVFENLHNFKGVLLPKMQRATTDPVIEKMYDLQGICEKNYENISERLAFLDYFNNEFNVRSATGMLQYQFRDMTDEINTRAAKMRADAHAGNYNLAHLDYNMNLLREFLSKVSDTKVILVIPPVTRFYREHSNVKLRDSFYEKFEPLKGEVEFVDLFNSDEFDDEDFQDYDHLNDRGAEKLSKIVGRII